MKPIREYIDVLILAALPEETLVLDVFLNDHRPESVTVEDKVFRRARVPCGSGDHLLIAMTDMGGMGNVNALDQTLRFIDRLCPRCAILLGCAGGRHGLVCRGDVGFSRGIGYSSFGKISSGSSLSDIIRLRWAAIEAKWKVYPEGEGTNVSALINCFRTPEFDPDNLGTVLIDPRQVKPIEVSLGFLGAARLLDREPSSWQALAAKLFVECADSFREKFCAPGAADKPYPPQASFERGVPLAREAVIASGESLVASGVFQQTLEGLFPPMDPLTKEDQRFCMYEMESYGFARACARRNITFGVVKGISDYAGADVLQLNPDKNRYRLASHVAATAFALELVREPGFMRSIRGNGSRPRWSSRTCIWTKPSPQECVLSVGSEHDIFMRHRHCTEIRHQALVAHESPRGCIYEDVEADVYSEFIADAMRNPLSQVLLIFPYAVRDLLAFFANSRSERLLRRVSDFEQDLYRARMRGKERNALANEALLLGQDARNTYEHFRVSNELCADMISKGKSFFEIAERMCRLVVMRRSEQEMIVRSPAALLYVGLCGVSVPTFIADEDFARKYFDDEATFIRLPRQGAGAGSPELTVTTCLKYADRSQMLTVMGRCDDLSSADAEPSKVFRLATDLHAALAQWRKATPSAAALGLYKVWPIMAILGAFNRNWQEFLPELATKPEFKDVATAYFDNLRNAEDPLGRHKGGLRQAES